MNSFSGHFWRNDWRLLSWKDFWVVDSSKAKVLRFTFISVDERTYSTFTLKRVTSFTFPLRLSTRLCWVFCSLLFCHWLFSPFLSLLKFYSFSLLQSRTCWSLVNGNRRVLCTLCFSETLGLSSNSKLFRCGVMLPLFPYCCFVCSLLHWSTHSSFYVRFDFFFSSNQKCSPPSSLGLHCLSVGQLVY